MAVHSFDTADNRRFWSAYGASYQGANNARPLVALVKNFLGERILDAGAADGSLLRELRRALPQAAVTGVDLAPKSDDVEAGDLTQLRFPDGAFDTVISSEVIEHTSPEITAAILRELLRVLEPRGALILTTPFEEDLAESTVTCPHCDVSFHRWGHQQTFGAPDFARLAREHGLAPELLLPVRFNRLRRVAFLGPRLLQTAAVQRFYRGERGKRSLVMVARRVRRSGS